MTSKDSYKCFTASKTIYDFAVRTHMKKETIETYQNLMDDYWFKYLEDIEEESQQEGNQYVDRSRKT